MLPDFVDYPQHLHALVAWDCATANVPDKTVQG